MKKAMELVVGGFRHSASGVECKDRYTAELVDQIVLVNLSGEIGLLS